MRLYVCIHNCRFDTGAPTIGKLYSSWYEVGEHLKTTQSEYANEASEAHARRWAYGHAAIAAAAYVLDPEFHSHDQDSNEEVMEGFLATLQKIGILVETRRRVQANNSNIAESWKLRAKMILDDPQSQDTWTHFPDYPKPNDPAVKEFCANANAQLAMYRSKKGTFSYEWVFDSAKSQPAYLWWSLNGSSVPELQQVACLVLSCPSSASTCERINGEFAFVKDKRRNRLKHAKAEKLTALFHNLRLINRLRNPNYTEPAVGWNEEDEKTGLLKYGVAHYEPAAAGKHKSVGKRAPVLEYGGDLDDGDVIIQLNDDNDGVDTPSGAMLLM